MLFKVHELKPERHQILFSSFLFDHTTVVQLDNNELNKQRLHTELMLMKHANK